MLAEELQIVVAEILAAAICVVQHPRALSLVPMQAAGANDPAGRRAREREGVASFLNIA